MKINVSKSAMMIKCLEISDDDITVLKISDDDKIGLKISDNDKTVLGSDDT